MTQPGFSRIAHLLADPAREAMLVALAGHDALPAGELARAAGLSAQSASGHLRKLVEGGVLRVQTQGRFRYYAIARTSIASAIEALCVAAGEREPSSGNRRLPAPDLCFARSCYGHLAGQLGVALAQGLARRGAIRTSSDALMVTEAGRRWLAKEFGLAFDTRNSGRRGPLFQCLDWTERRYHLAGPVAARLLTRLIELRWVARAKSSRALRLTALGERKLAALGIDIPQRPASKSARAAHSR